MPAALTARRCCLLCCSLVGAASLPTYDGAAGEAATYVEGVLVLLNGNAVKGHIQRSGDWYLVRHGSVELQVPAGQVEMYCGSLEEAYEVRRRRRPENSADDRAELASWCLRHGLLQQARQEIAAVHQLDPQHPPLRRLSAQLGQAIQQKERTERLGAPIGATSNAVAASWSHAAPSVDPSPTDPALELPLAARSEFVRSIQPMLVHSCGNSGCHQPDSQRAFQLERLAMAGSGHPALVARNLAHTLQQIDRESPANSSLVDYASRAHGESPQAQSRPLRPHQAALLREWISKATRQSTPTQLAPDETGESPQFSQAIGATADKISNKASSVDQIAPEQVAPEQIRPAQIASEQIASERIDARQDVTFERLTHQPIRVGVELKTFVPRDEFDPEIFHRRHSLRRSPAEFPEIASGQTTAAQN